MAASLREHSCIPIVINYDVNYFAPEPDPAVRGAIAQGMRMPHIVIEYSAGLGSRVDLPALLVQVHQAALATGVFPIGGVRTRAYSAENYLIADGHPDNAFVHLTVRVGQGRDLETRNRACKAIFDAACRHLAPVFDTRPLGISIEMLEIDPALSFRQNNLHAYVAQRGRTTPA